MKLHRMGEISVKASKWRVAEEQLREALDILDMDKEQKANVIIDKAEILEVPRAMSGISEAPLHPFSSSSLDSCL